MDTPSTIDAGRRAGFRPRLFAFAFAAVLLVIAPLRAAEVEPSRAVLVTGASSGIGLTITRHLAERGFHVYAGARKDADLERLNGMDNVSSVRLDVTRQQDIDAAVTFIGKEGRGLFAVVNNAGIATLGSLGTVSDEDVLRIHDVNVMGPLRVNRAFLPMLIRSKGRTVLIGSLSGFLTGPSGGAYSMSKFAAEAYTDTLAEELADTGVSVGIIDPGAYRSRGREKAVLHMLTGGSGPQSELSEEQEAILESVRQANEKLKEPHEVAEAVIHFLTSDSPRQRYMVAPNAETADLAIRAALRRVVQLNAAQPYECSRDELVELLDALLAGNGGDRASAPGRETSSDDRGS